jgi:four helix bundle protein
MNWKDLKIWQKAHALVLEVYRLTNGFPKEEVYGLTSQIRRSASSVPANIVEGQSRNTTKEYLVFLYNARGSLEETRYHLLLSKDLGYMEESIFEALESRCEEISKMLNSLIRSLKEHV